MTFWNRFYFKISLVFVALIVAMAAVQARIASGVFDRQRDEIDQRANVMLAADMAAEIEPYLGPDFGSDDVGSAIHYMMVLNPLIEIYLLSAEGEILAFFADSQTAVESSTVDLTPIQRFLEGGQPLPIYGDDPRRPDQPSTFSVAPLAAGFGGYLYVILGSGLYDTAKSEIEDGYIRAALRESLLYTLPFVAVIGLVAFFLLTMRLQRLTSVVREFGKGDYGARAVSGSRDEIGELAGTFNTMAATIQENVHAIERAETDRRDLVANISHDLRTPLAAVRGYTETLLEKGAQISDDEQKRYLRISLGSIDAVNGLVEDLFELSKLEARDHALLREEFSLSELCQDVVMQLTPLAEKNAVRLKLSPPSGLYLVVGDIPMVERVMTNLLDNGLRFAPPDSCIDISLTQEGSTVRVSITDRGPGVSSGETERVFDRFYTGDPSRSSGRNGLGLAIAKRIVDLHNGTIGVDSAPGEGSTFYFCIPLLER